MRFIYPKLSTVEISNMRVYETPAGDFYPSITTVLGKTMPAEKVESLEQWRQGIGVELADEQTREAARHGTAVHLLIERYLNNEPLVKAEDAFTNDDISAFKVLKPQLNKIEEIWGQEVSLFSNKLGLAGRCDFVGVYKGKPCIIDFKTSRKIKAEHKINDYKIQVCAYGIMHDELLNTNIVDGFIFMSSGSGFPQEFHVNLKEQEPLLTRRVNEFYSNLSI